MTIEQAIEKAIEGGYNGYPKPFCMECGGYESPNKSSSMFLDPLFWQSLVTAMEWDRDLEGLKCSCSEDIYYSYQFCPKCGKQMRKVEVMTTYWKKEWHRFIDHIAEGKSAEDFFKTLTH